MGGHSLASAKTYDVIIVGAGHNGLVAAILLARRGLKVLVLEEQAMVGGAAKTERPFKLAPELATSSGSYLLGPMPPELLQKLDVELPTIRRDPHYFLPTLDGRYLLFGSNAAEMQEQFTRFFSAQDFAANQALNAELDHIRQDLAPAWLAAPLSLHATADKYIRPALRQVFIDLVQQPVENYLGRFGFNSELLIAMYAVTDGFSGLTGSFGTPGSGHNFLVHNMCRLPGSDGTFMLSKGGMGTITQRFAAKAVAHGAEIVTTTRVEQILVEAGKVTGVAGADGQELRARVVLVNADPFRMQKLVGENHFSPAFNQRLAKLKRPGTTMKINLALDRLPTFSCLASNRGQHHSTVHLLPSEPNVISQIRRSFDQAMAGQLPDFPSIEWYFHTPADPSMQDQSGRHNSAFFVQWVPNEIVGSSWEKEEAGYVDRLLDIGERFAPGFKASVVDTFTLTPPKIEQHFGITAGHIHHIDNTFSFDQRMPYAAELDGLYSCSAGCHPAGSVVGAAGHNAAEQIISDLD